MPWIKDGEHLALWKPEWSSQDARRMGVRATSYKRLWLRVRGNIRVRRRTSPLAARARQLSGEQRIDGDRAVNRARAITSFPVLDATSEGLSADVTTGTTKRRQSTDTSKPTKECGAALASMLI
jgi:hypothetical protein